MRYDDELEYWARAHGDTDLADQYGGTPVSVYSVILSVLFDDSGFVRGIRAVTDPRVGLAERTNSHFMAGDIHIRFLQEIAQPFHVLSIGVADGEVTDAVLHPAFGGKTHPANRLGFVAEHRHFLAIGEHENRYSMFANAEYQVRRRSLTR